MNNILCIFPKDTTTEFLEPLFYELCEKYKVTPLLGDPQDDDDYLDKLSETSAQSDAIIFLGHGSSKALYGVNFNELILADNVEMFRGKRLFLFACNSVEFIKNYKLSQALGFGMIPTSDYDVENVKLYSLPLKDLTSLEIDFIQKTIVRIWKRTLAEADLSDVRNFYKGFSYYTDVEIVACLKKREQQNFRLIADILYYLKTDMNYFE